MIFRTLIVLSFWFIGQGIGHAEALATSFVDVFVKDVPVGSPYYLSQGAKKRIEFLNQGNRILEVKVEILKPETAQLVAGAVPIPDLSWIEVLPSKLLIDPADTATCDLKILIPDKKSHRNKTYQVTLWSRGQRVQTKGLSVGPGVISQFRFRTR